VPFRVFGAAARPATLPAWVVLLWNRVLVQSLNPAKYLVIASMIPLCPSEFSVLLIDPRRHRLKIVLFWNQWLVQSVAPTEVSPLLLL
jgi:hypothetical protein